MGRWILAGVLGLVGAFLIYMESAMVFTDMKDGGPSGGFVAITFLGGWAASTWFIGRKARGLSHVMARGSLLGAALWLLMAGAGLILSGKAVVETTAATGDSAAATAGAAIGGGVMAVMAGGLSFAMVFVCLVSFLVFWLVGRDRVETANDASLVACPRCAEKIQRAAKACRHCGADVVATVAGG